MKKKRSDTMNLILYRRKVKRRKKINNNIIRTLGILIFVIGFIILPLNEMDATPLFITAPLGLVAIFKPGIFEFDIFSFIEEVKDDFKNCRFFR